MATEQGTIIRTNHDRAWVKTTRSQACESCASRDACGVMGGANNMEVEVLNPVQAGIGDLVLIHFGTGSLLKATFLLYVFPILCLLAGAFLGESAAPRFGLTSSSASAVSGLLAFALSFIYVRSKGDRLARRKEYQPEITRVLQKYRPTEGEDRGIPSP